MKIDFIRSNKVDPASAEKIKSTPNTTKTKTARSSKSRNGSTEDLQDEENLEDYKKSAKRTRGRSRTFTFSKGGTSPKKHKGEVSESTRSRKSVDLPKSPSVVSLGKGNNSGFFSSSKSSVPEDFVSYLRKEQRPEVVEVGKVHRLRQILRNETVAWVESFIKLGGMAEIVALLHRIMEVEWRSVSNNEIQTLRY
jgi:hypothetical protein